jgi:hypothetical protein
MTMPIVLATGTLLNRNGLDRKRRAVFRIDPALLKFMPKPEECTEDDVAKAYKFLADEWLVDVAANAEGKCVLLAFTLSNYRACPIPRAPAFLRDRRPARRRQDNRVGHRNAGGDWR